MKIIADTSIWIEFLKFNKEYYHPLKKKLENLEVFAAECIFGELLQGTKSKNEQQTILKYWNSLPKLNEANISIKAGIYSADNNLINNGIGLIDSILIVLAKENRLRIWTKDKKLCNFLDKNLTFSTYYGDEKITLLFDEEVYEKLREKSGTDNVSIGELVREAVATYYGIKSKEEKMKALNKLKTMNLAVKNPEIIEVEILKGRNQHT